jgi:VWFA-related protein
MGFDASTQHARRTAICGLVIGVSVAVVATAGPSDPHQPSATQDQFRSGTTAIVVDVVVRDRQGHPVTDLAASDFELLEDEVRQEIGNVTLVGPAARRESQVRPTQGTADATSSGSRRDEAGETRRAIEAPAFVALVFDRLSPEARALAHKGALAYLAGASPDDFAGVFLIDLHLETIQTYTNDRGKLRKAIDEVASRATTTFSRDAGRIRGAGVPGDPHPAASPTAGPEDEGPPDPNTQERLKQQSAPGDPAAARMMELALRMERTYEAMIRDQQGFATTNGLLALVDALGLLPGRKTVVFFAEGLAIPANVQARFDSVVATANRANVSVYSIDAAGLRVHSKAAETARQIKALGEIGVGDRARDEKQAWTRDLELNEDILKQDPSASLGILAERTGGFLIDNTNDLERGFRQIDADRRFHYLLTYTPKNSDFRGEWRRIAVKVARRDATVRARAGYVAVRTPGALPLLAHEGPALAALERSPLPGEIPVRAGAFVFPQRAGNARLAVLIASSGTALTFDTQRANTYRTDFTVLARIRDAAGDVVRKASEPYRLTGPAAQAEAAKRGDVLFFRRPDLAPGRYTLEYVVHDALAKRAGAGTAPVIVPPARAGELQVSSLVIVRRSERVPAAERDPDNPLYYRELLLYPNLGEPVSKAGEKALSFYFIVVPGQGAPASASLELVQGGRAVGQVPLQLAAPGSDGRIQHVAQLPLSSFPPGEYEIRIVITQGNERQVRTAAFRVVE